jgi:hypothetical protein
MGDSGSVQTKGAGLDRPIIAKSLAFLRQKSSIDLKAMNLRESVQAWMACQPSNPLLGTNHRPPRYCDINVVNKNNPD